MTRKILQYILFTLVVFLAFFQCLQAQVIARESKTASARVTVNIVVPLTAHITTQLNFGKFLPNESQSSIQISPEGRRQVYGDETLRVYSSYSPARYYLSGENAVTCEIVLPEGPTIVSNAEHSKTMHISDWRADIFSEETISRFGGIQQVSLGATLFIGTKEENPTGVYAGSYAITFMYN